MTTTAYQMGIYDGNVVYRVTSHATIEKDFFFDKNDNLIIRTGENATYYDGYLCTGKATVYDISKGKHDFISENYLTPQFDRGSGVLYEFPVVQDTGPGCSYNPRQTEVDGDYYLVATNTTEVQSTYVHNQNIFTDSLSVSFGPVGVNIPLGSFDAAIYYATPMTLPGYYDIIERELHTVNQEDYGFEQQYFFDEKIKEHFIDGLNFTTNRLRCGYIEEEYINLSPLRKGAGEAYLEFNFKMPIYEMSTYLTFWSNNERYEDGDIANISYLTNDGEWITLFDLLNNDNPLPTDRKNPKRYEFNFVNGTKGIRFYSHVKNPVGDRNKGRICVGETAFTTYNFK